MNKNNWSQQETMMAGAYKNIAQSLSQIQMYMKNHLNMVKNGGGIINEGDLEEILKQLADMINKNLHNVSQGRVSFNIENLPSTTNSFSNASPIQSQPPQAGLNDNIIPKYNTIRESKNKNVVRLTESQLHNIIAKSVKRVLRESDDFIGHGYKTTSNLGGNEIQISNSGDAARLKLPSGEITDWLEIEFDEEGVAYITTPDGDTERLDEYMRFY